MHARCEEIFAATILHKSFVWNNLARNIAYAVMHFMHGNTHWMREARKALSTGLSRIKAGMVSTVDEQGAHLWQLFVPHLWLPEATLSR